MKVYVDTGGWIAYFDAADHYHAVFDNFFRETLQNRTHQLFTSDVVIIETATHLRYTVGGTEAVAAFDKLRLLQRQRLLIVFATTDERMQRARDLMAQYVDQKLSFVDCISFALCEAHQIDSVVTVDSHFIVRGLSIVPEDLYQSLLQRMR
jgi:hypothetical protein